MDFWRRPECEGAGTMNLLERIWELLGLVFSSLLRGFERAMTSVFGSQNARYIKRLQGQVDAINSLEPKYQAMSDEELREQTDKFRQRLERRGKRWMTCWWRPLPSVARRAAAIWTCAISMCR